MNESDGVANLVVVVREGAEVFSTGMMENAIIRFNTASGSALGNQPTSTS